MHQGLFVLAIVALRALASQPDQRNLCRVVGLLLCAAASVVSVTAGGKASDRIGTVRSEASAEAKTPPETTIDGDGTASPVPMSEPQKAPQLDSTAKADDIQAQGSVLSGLLKFGSKGEVRFVLDGRWISPGVRFLVIVENQGEEEFVLRSDVWRAVPESGAAFACERESRERLTVPPGHSADVWLLPLTSKMSKLQEFDFSSADLTLSIRDSYSPPRVVRSVPPFLPIGLDEIIQATPITVRVGLIVGADGRLVHVVPDHPETPGQPKGRWLAAILDAVNKWEFEPARSSRVAQRALLHHSFELFGQKALKRVFSVPLKELEPRVSAYLHQAFSGRVVELRSVHGFVAAAGKTSVNTDDIGASAALVRLGESPSGTWMVVSSMRLFER